MKFIGVDGCKKGWFAVTLFSDCEKYEIGVFSTISDLIEHNSDCQLILIDIPIGLPHTGPRECDLQARKVLGAPRASSVFPTPCREAVYANSYEEACENNLKVLGKKIPKQSWAISKKIREVDSYLRVHSSLHVKVRESHPEICFWGLAGGNPMRYNKKKEIGSKERLEILSNLFTPTYEVFSKALLHYQRKDVALDDILDALVLAVTASRMENLRTLPENPQRDAEGLRMEIVSPVIE